MSMYDDFRRKIHGPTVPLPIFFNRDLSIDYAGIEKYIAWILDEGVTNTCLTYGYSQLGCISREELIELTRVMANAIGDRAVFIGSTRDDSALEVAADARRIQELGAHAVFVMGNMISQGGADYRRVLDYVARQTDLPILFFVYPAHHDLRTPNVGKADLDLLLQEHANIVGLKDDFRNVAYRKRLIRDYGDRLCVIGGGLEREYLFFHRHPGQGELDGMFNPATALRFLEVLDDGRLNEALDMIDEQERAYAACPATLHMLARNQVIMHKMGFAATCQTRPPIVSATEEQASQVAEWAAQFPEIYKL